MSPKGKNRSAAEMLDPMGFWNKSPRRLTVETSHLATPSHTLSISRRDCSAGSSSRLCLRVRMHPVRMHPRMRPRMCVCACVRVCVCAGIWEAGRCVCVCAYVHTCAVAATMARMSHQLCTSHSCSSGRQQNCTQTRCNRSARYTHSHSHQSPCLLGSIRFRRHQCCLLCACTQEGMYLCTQVLL